MSADLALINGPVFTSVESRPFVEAVAVAEGRIVQVGDRVGAEALIGPTTRVIDLKGRLATAGYQDAHIHPGMSGMEMMRCYLTESANAEEALAEVTRYAAMHPDEPWIRGSGWSQDWFPKGCPDRDLLDTIVPDRPVFLQNRDGHGAWVNTLALDRAGVDGGTPDPADGRIERRDDGSPQGTLHEGAQRLVSRLFPAEGADEHLAGLVRAQDYLLSLGITGWQDAHVDEVAHEAYLSMAASGELLARVAGALWWDRLRGLEQIDELVERSSQSSGRYRPVAVKLMLDGVVENFTAAMKQPYLDGSGAPTSNRGIDFIDPDLLGDVVTGLDAAGLSCHFHAIGDRAVSNALDAVEQARSANGKARSRHHIAHIQVVHPADIPRFARSNVTANCQPLWACDGGYQTELTQPWLGPERSSWQYPFGSLHRSGARLAMGSDWDVSTPDVFSQIDVAVTRSDVDLPDEAPLIPTEAIGLGDALIGFTAGSAYVNHLDSETGTVEPGKLADLVVLDRNPFEEPRPAGTLVDFTIIEGEVVYQR